MFLPHRRVVITRGEPIERKVFCLTIPCHKNKANRKARTQLHILRYTKGVNSRKTAGDTKRYNLSFYKNCKDKTILFMLGSLMHKQFVCRGFA